MYQPVSPESHVINCRVESHLELPGSRQSADAWPVAPEEISVNKTTRDGDWRGEKRTQETTETKPEVEEGGAAS